MSYCRFRNTLSDLRDCRDFIECGDLSPEEHAARRWLIKLCRDIVRDADDNPELEEIKDVESYA